MQLSSSAQQKQKINADSLRRHLRFPIPHGQNLPPAVDLRRWMTTIEDQGEMGSCVANTIAGRSLFRTRITRILFLYFDCRCSGVSLPTLYWEIGGC